MLTVRACLGLTVATVVGCAETQVIGEGAVFDTCGRPVHDAVILVSIMSEGPPFLLDSVRTDAQGRFRYSAMLSVSRPELRAEVRLAPGMLAPMTVVSDSSPTFRFAYDAVPTEQPCR
jgi:hypothetical protein